MTTFVNASCQCQLNSFRVKLDTTSLPAVVHYCHCSTCRHSSGQMIGQYIFIQGPPLQRKSGLSTHSSRSRSRSPSRAGGDDRNSYQTSHHGNRVALSVVDGKLSAPSISVEEEDVPFLLDDMTAYNSSPNVTRYFCKSCSAHLFWYSQNVWCVTGGVLDRLDRDVTVVGHHIFVGDTVDGGLADHLRDIDGVTIPRYKTDDMKKGNETLPFPWKATEYAPSIANQGSQTQADRLDAFCHCGAISFAITRPSEASFTPTAPYPDLLYPYDAARLATINNSGDEKWWLRPRASQHPTKYLAGHCMCSSCRFSSGCAIQSWAFVPLANIIHPNDSTPLCLENEQGRPPGLKQYIGSPGEYVEFCGTCGATAFSWQAGTPDLVHVSVGLVNEKLEGARAEGWFEWHKERVSYMEAALDTSLAQGLAKGLEGDVL